VAGWLGGAVPARAGDAAAYAGYTLPGCGALAAVEPAGPEASRDYIETVSFAARCESGETAELRVQIGEAGMMLIRRFAYVSAGGTLTWAPSVDAALRAACGCR
jgi:hypothetical protein